MSIHFQKYEEPYPNIYGQQVSWEFVEAVDCFAVYDEIVTGTEVYSCLHKRPKGTSDDYFMKNLLKNVDFGCWMARHM